MAARMQDGRDADAAKARQAGMPMSPDFGVARERSFSVPQLVRAVYGVRPLALTPSPRVRAVYGVRGLGLGLGLELGFGLGLGAVYGVRGLGSGLGLGLG